MKSITNLLITSAVLLTPLYSFGAGETLPPCPPTGVKNNCIGQLSDLSGVYTGEYKNGRPEGRISIDFANGGTFTGFWKDGKFYGPGKAVANDGTMYEGEYREGKFNGPGTLSMLGGAKYVGEFKNGKFSGNGKLYSASGQVSGEGIWEDGKLIQGANSPSQKSAKAKEVQATDVEKDRAEKLARLRTAAGAEGAPVRLGSWPNKIIERVKPLIAFDPNSVPGNPVVVFSVYLSPEGYILRKRILTSSGYESWDGAIGAALDSAKSLPLNEAGEVPQNPVILKFQPKEGASPVPAKQVDIRNLIVKSQPDADAYYPSFSMRSGEQGRVSVRLIVGINGLVEDVALLQSSTFPRLDRAALEIARSYQYQPVLEDGSPVRFSTTLQIVFNLKN